MKLKRLLATLMTVALLLSAFPAMATAPYDGPYEDTLVIEFYNVAANYQGIQAGWFGKILKDKFNIEVNIIAPQVSGSAIYQARTSAGFLGDLVILGPEEFADCVQAGLIREIGDGVRNMESLTDFYGQIETVNNSLFEDGGIYALPLEMMDTSPTTVTSEQIYSSPLLRWDLYKEVGSPVIEDLDGLIEVLAAMMEAQPTNADGDPAYGMSLWPDWDGGDGMLGIANAAQLTTWYGEKIKGSLLLKPDGTFVPVTDKDGAYYKALHFLNKANRAGIVDPDSGTQDWSNAVAKMSAGQVYLMWYSWQVGFWNSVERQQNGTAFTFIPIEDQLYYADSDNYYGSGRLWGVGANVEGEKYDRIMEFIDWYASPEGLTIEHIGLEGFNYGINEDGKYYVMNDNALMDNLPVPEEWGGGGYDDGFNDINQWIINAAAMNPDTGERYAYGYWDSYKEQMMTDMKREWQEMFDAEYAVDYMIKNNKLVVSPSVSVSLPGDTPDISIIRNQCSDLFSDYSWRMIFAADDEKFDQMWDDMTEHMNGFDFETLVEFDIAKYTIELDAKNAAKEAAE